MPALPTAAQTWHDEAMRAPLRSVWITPHEPRYLRVPQLPPPRYQAVQLNEDGDEECFDWSCYVKSGAQLPARLGLDTDHQTLLRLAKAGFIGVVRVTPSNYLIDLSSLHDFLVAASDPAFWTTQRRQRYAEVNASDPWV